MTKGLQELLEKHNISDGEAFETELNKVLAETHVPKSVFNETNEKLKTAKQESADKDKLLEEAKKGGADFETLKSQYDELVKKQKADEERHEAEMLATRKGYAIDAELTKAGVRNSKYFKSMLDDSKIKYENETLSGLVEQIDAIKKSDPYLFNEVRTNPRMPSWGSGNGGGTGGNGGDTSGNDILSAMGVL